MSLNLVLVLSAIFVSFSSAQECHRALALISDGATFEPPNCDEICKCKSGKLDCTPRRCADVLAPGCRFVEVPNQCCWEPICDYAGTPCQEPTNITASDMVQRFPWSLLICTDATCKQRYKSVILDDRRVLTLAPKLSAGDLFVVSKGGDIDYPENDMVMKTVARPSVSVKVHPDFADESKANVLQIIQFNKTFLATKTIRRVNLPDDNGHCSNVSKDECPLLAVGHGAGDNLDTIVAKKSTKNENSCKVTNASGKGDKRFCVGGFKDAKCAPIGGAVLATQTSRNINAEFVVGLFDSIPDASNSCKQADSIDVLPLCKYVDWIKEQLKA